MAEGLAFQITSIVVLFFIGIIGTLIPLFFNKKISILAYLNIFAAGVFLAIGLMTILPEAAEHLEIASEQTKEFPWAYFLTIVGFFIIFLTEEVAHVYYRKAFGRSSHDDLESPVPGQTEFVQSADVRMSEKRDGQVAPMTSEEHHSLLAAIVLLLALSIHEVLEGFSIGAMENAWGLLVALIFHKTVESLALGAAFVRANINRRAFFAIIFVYSLMLPLGIGLGIASQQEGTTLTGVLLALSAGSFLYISTAEIIPEEFHIKHQKDRAIRYLFLFGGTVVMSVMILLEEIAELATEDEELQGTGMEF